MKTYKCQNCKKEVTAIIIKKPRCKECQVAMAEVTKEKLKENYKIQGEHIYIPKRKGNFLIDGKIAYGKSSTDERMLRFIKNAFSKTYRGDIK